MKRIVVLVTSAIVLVVAVFLIAFYSWDYFNTRKPKTELNTLEIVLSDEGNVNLSEQSPTSEESATDIIPYIFKVVNKSDKSSKYQVLLEDYISDNTKSLLSRKVLRYELKQDGITIKTGSLSEIKNNILDQNNILAKEEKKYELRIWVDENVDSSDWVGKSYNYNVKVNPVID